MAVLINGNGNPAVYAAQDADWFASIMGNTTAITGVGEQFAATQEDANTISIADGVIITQEGRRIQLDANESDLFDIPTGTQGTTNYYIIGYHLTTDETSAQSCDTFVQLMDNGTDTIQEDTFRDGADEVYISLYRVTQTGLNITAIDLLLPTISSIAQLSQHLTAYYDKTTKKWYEINSDGTIGGEIKMGKATLDFGNPLHTFANGVSWTATEDCHLTGCLTNGANNRHASLTIDGKTMDFPFTGYDSYNGNSVYIDDIPISEGTAVSVSIPSGFWALLEK